MLCSPFGCLLSKLVGPEALAGPKLCTDFSGTTWGIVVPRVIGYGGVTIIHLFIKALFGEYLCGPDTGLCTRNNSKQNKKFLPSWSLCSFWA